MNIMLEPHKVQLIPATIKDHPILQNMGRFYVYDMSEFMGWEMPEDGLYECIDFLKYWKTTDTHPCIIRYDNELAGFVIIDKKGSDSSIDFNMAQFFILRKFKNNGLGRYVAHQCFNNFQGTWEVMVMPGNEGAYRFWHATIKKFTDNHFEEYSREVAHFNHELRDFFKFDSQMSNH